MMQLDQIMQLIGDGADKAGFPDHPERLYSPARYIMEAGGKRIRPALALIAANLFTDHPETCTGPALAMEVFHNFTLIHDDIMDQAPLRRGRATVHEKWDLSTAILSGDVMMIRAWQLMMEMEDNNLRAALEMFNDTAVKVCEGQQYDMDFELRDDVSLDEYITMIQYKTSVLLGCSLYCGALAGGGNQEDADLLYAAGVQLGVGFQIQDDLLDAYGDEKKFGKKPGGDIVRNKKTYLLLRLLEKCNENDRQLLREISADTKLEESKKIASVIALYDKYSLYDEAIQTIQKYYQEAVVNIHSVSVTSERKQVLLALAEQILNRDF